MSFNPTATMGINPALIMPEAGDVPNNAPVGSLSGDEAGYWKTPQTHPDSPGFVTMRQVGMNSVEMFFRGWESLLQKYGAFNLNQGPDKLAWKPNDDPFLRIVMMNGLHEFPAKQVISLNWHRRPSRTAHRSHKLIWERIDQAVAQGLSEEEAVLTVLPQLRGLDLQTWTCDFCPDRRFNEEIHLRRHESVMHRDDVRSRELKTGLEMALSKGVPGGAQTNELLIQMIAEVAKTNASTQAALLDFLRQQQVAVPTTPSEAASATLAVDLEAVQQQLEADAEAEANKEPRGPRAYRIGKQSFRDAQSEPAQV